MQRKTISSLFIGLTLIDHSVMRTNYNYHYLLILSLLGKSVFGFCTNIRNRKQSTSSSPALISNYIPLCRTELHAFTHDQELAFWMTSFSTSHIGMSAIRGKIINVFGQLALNSSLVDRGVKLPSYWPGKNASFNFLER